MAPEYSGDGVVFSEVRFKTIIIFPFLFFKKNTDKTDRYG
jgi:hypothetical protein